jgi:hypothetical protein
MTLPVSDTRSNPNDQIAHAARVIGKSAQRRAVFGAISRGKRRTKTVKELMRATGLSQKQVLNAAKHLADNQVIRQTRVGKETGYEKDPFYSRNKAKILRLAGNPTELEKLPTKTNPQPRQNVIVKVSYPGPLVRMEQVTIDDIDSFSRVRNVTDAPPPGEALSETAFKHGFQNVIGEEGTFKDWGGERNDLLTTRVRLGGRRRTAGVAFKGPGTRGKLTPAKLGKNADQIQRLFSSPADVFLVQYWGQIDETVLEQMRNFAAGKSAIEGRPIWFGVIDGTDTRRLMAAYPEDFEGGTRG